MKSFFFVLLLLASQSLALAKTDLDLGSPASATPYDPYMSPVKLVLNHLTRLANDQNAMDRVRHLMHQGRQFRYSFTSPYVAATPAVTAATRAGDCKAKALWLASKMDTRNVRFVIGKASLERSANHAWLIWEGPQGWLILDATMLSRPLSPDRTSPSDYVPSYSYSPTGKYAHAVVAAAASKKYSDHL